MAEVNIYICYIDNISNALEVTYNLLKITLRNVIKTQSRRTAVFIDRVMNFSTREWRPFVLQLKTYRVKSKIEPVLELIFQVQNIYLIYTWLMVYTVMMHLDTNIFLFLLIFF